MLNKPSGFITTVNDERQRWTVMDLVQVPERVYPVGRLDRDTQGLLLLTNDGAVANRVMHPRYGLTEEYHIVTGKRPTDVQLQKLRDGIWVNDRLVVPDECRLMRETAEGVIVRIVLHEGIYHVVRLMMESVGIEVGKLRRVRLGPLVVQGIPPGAWRDLTPGELVQLYQAVGLPVEEAERLNGIRPLQLQPVGGFVHNTPAPESPRDRAAPRPEGSGQDRSSQQRSPGRAKDGSRSPASHRSRRTGGSR
jgi:pseudouridine synthase